MIYNRIAGVPPAKEVVDEMVGLLEAGKKKEAALLATESAGFYNVKLLNVFGAWANVSGNSGIDLNDMIATMIGMVRDDLPFNEVLSSDYLYTAKKENNAYINGVPAYQLNNNNHYSNEGVSRYTSSNLQYSDLRETLERNSQTELTAFPQQAIAGVLSSRGFASAYYSAGTNRRATAFVLKYFLCHDIESLHDITVPDTKVRRDVDRAPGGDAGLFRSRCVGCHAGMDAMSGWSVYYDFNDQQMVYSTDKVQEKITRNFDVFTGGHEPTDDAFENLWVDGQNSVLGWGKKTSGRGAAEWGAMITASDAFAACMATHVYKHVCMGTLETQKEKTLRDGLASDFKSEGYNMKKLFASTAVACLPEEEG